MQKIEEMTLEEKVDELLKYQRRQRIYGIVRTVFNVLIFVVVIILPIWGFYYMVDYLQNTVGIDFSQIGGSLKSLNNLKDIGTTSGLTDLLK